MNNCLQQLFDHFSCFAFLRDLAKVSSSPHHHHHHLITITITIINIIIIDLAKVSSPPLPLPRILCIKTSGSALQEKSITP